jgi:hypothetical protein
MGTGGEIGKEFKSLRLRTEPVVFRGFEKAEDPEKIGKVERLAR